MSQLRDNVLSHEGADDVEAHLVKEAIAAGVVAGAMFAGTAQAKASDRAPSGPAAVAHVQHGTAAVVFDSGTTLERSQVTRALAASSFDWSRVPPVTVHIGSGYGDEASRGEIWIDSELLHAGTFAWGVVQHEYAHEVDFFLLNDADLAHAWNLDEAKDLSFATYDGATTWPRDFKWAFPHRTCTGGKCVTTWNDERPRCTTHVCTLPRKRDAVHDAPPGLQLISARLARAVKSPCLPGWWTDVQSRDIEAHSPRDRASFHVSTAPVGPMTAARWANTFTRSAVHHLGGVTRVDGNAYAETFVDNTARPQLTDVSVYYVRRGRGYRLLGTAPTAIFPLFERDFARLFRSTGVAGDLFPELRGETSGCAA